jgi:hypothetical protein
MKKLILSTVLLAGLSTSVSLYAQGTVFLENSTGGLIYLGLGNATPLAVDVNAELLGGIPGGSLAPLATLVGAATAGITVDFGRVADPTGLSRIVPGVTPGQNAALQLRLWMGNSTTYGGAVSAGAFVADSGVFTNPTGGDGIPPALPKGLSGLPEMHLTNVPEPSTLALAGLGAAALLMYRRRTA